MKNEMTTSLIYKKKQVFTIKEKARRKKSKTITSPSIRQRRHTEPILSELGKLKKQLRMSSEYMSIQRNQVPPYPQAMRQRAISIPSSYQQYQMHQPTYGYGNSSQYDSNNTPSGPINQIYSPSRQQQQQQQQQQSNNQININNNLVNQIAPQSSSSSSSTQLNSSSITSPTQNNGVYNSNNQRNIQQAQQVYMNAPPVAIEGQYKGYANTSTVPGSYQQLNTQNPTQGSYDMKGYNNNKGSSFVKQNNSSINSMTSSCTNPVYSNSSQTDCSINHPSSSYNEQQHQPYISSAPVIQKSNSWVGGDQRYPESTNIFSEPPPLYQTQSSVPSYRNQNDYSKYSNSYNPTVREIQPSTNYVPYKGGSAAVAAAKGSSVNAVSSSSSTNCYNPYTYLNVESQQIQNTPSTIASRTSQSPHNGRNIDSFEHGQNLYRSQSENIEQDLQDFFIDSNKGNEQENEDGFIDKNYYKDSDMFMNNNNNNNNIFNDENELPNYMSYNYNNPNFQNNSNYFQSNEFSQYAEYQ